jgi:hypothetical protein
MFTEPIYLDFSPAYAYAKGTDHVYKVSKSLYGDVWTSKLLYTHLHSILIDQLNFTISKVYSCLFFCGSIVFIFYVDDGIIVANDHQMIDSFISELRTSGLDLNIEDDYAGYLGVEIKPNQDGSLLLSQIRQI